MKEAYCATEPARSKVLCANPTSRYSSLQTSRSVPTAINWYCAIAANKETPECKRSAISVQLREMTLAASKTGTAGAAASRDSRTKLLEELKAHPFNYASMQAIQADFCKVPSHAADSSCLRLKQTQAQAAMQEWYCALPSSLESLWCKRTAILKKLHGMPAASAQSAGGAGTSVEAMRERANLLAELRTVSKRASGKMSGTLSVSKELAEAKLAYCKLPANTASAYCQSKPGSFTFTPFGGALGRRRRLKVRAHHR